MIRFAAFLMFLIELAGAMVISLLFGWDLALVVAIMTLLYVNGLAGSVAKAMS